MKWMNTLIVALLVFGSISTAQAETHVNARHASASDEHREFNLEAGLSMGGPAGWQNIGLEVELLEFLGLYAGVGLSYNDHLQYALMSRLYLPTNSSWLRIGFGAGASAGRYEFVQGQNTPLLWVFCGAWCTGAKFRYENELAFWANAEAFVGAQMTDRFSMDVLVGYAGMLNTGDNRCTTEKACYLEDGTGSMYIGIRAAFDINPTKL